MARTSLIDKLKARKDYGEIVKKVSNHPKPVKYIQDTFGVTYVTAKKFVDEALSGVKVVEVDPVAKKAEIFIQKMYISFNPNSNPSSLTFGAIGEELERFPTAVLKEIFKVFTEKEAKTGHDFLLIRAIKYLIQKKYYSLILKKEMSEDLIKQTDQIVGECF